MRPTMKHHVGVSWTFTLAISVLAWPLLSQTPSLDDVLKRSREMVARYEEQAALLLADEQCDQKAFESTQERSNSPYAFQADAVRVDPKGRRKWQAELAMIRTPQLAAIGSPWMEFRDIIAVDGRPLADRAQRLSRLFLEQAGWSLEKAKEIAEESARFNIGGLRRTVTTPAVPLLVLHPVNAARFSFEKTGEEVVENVKTWKIDYRERRAPTLISSNDGSCPASGTFWIDPVTGEVVRALLQCVPTQAPDSVNVITVTYRRDPKLGIRVPFEMVERPEGNSARTSWAGQGRAWVEGKCAYSNFRRFETAAKVIPPK